MLLAPPVSMFNAPVIVSVEIAVAAAPLAGLLPIVPDAVSVIVVFVSARLPVPVPVELALPSTSVPLVIVTAPLKLALLPESANDPPN